MSWLGQGRGKKGHGFQSGASAGWGVAGCGHVMSHYALVSIFACKSPSLCTLLLIVLLLLLFVFLSRCCFQWISVKTHNLYILCLNSHLQPQSCKMAKKLSAASRVSPWWHAKMFTKAWPDTTTAGITPPQPLHLPRLLPTKTMPFLPFPHPQPWCKMVLNNKMSWPCPLLLTWEEPEQEYRATFWTFAESTEKDNAEQCLHSQGLFYSLCCPANEQAEGAQKVGRSHRWDSWPQLTKVIFHTTRCQDQHII